MSEQNDAASRTEEPTPRKLQQAREKGDVVKTPDLAALMSLAGVAAVIAMAGGYLMKNMVGALTPFIARPETLHLDAAGAAVIARHAGLAAAPLLGAVLVAAMVAGAAGNLVQHGLMYTPEKLKPDIKKVSPLEGFKRIYGPDGLMYFVKSLVKVSLTALIAWWAVRPHLAAMQQLSAYTPDAMMPFMGDILKRLVFAVVGLLLVIAAFDWLWQRQRFMARMRMTREELKEDYKQTEGDPMVKARQRQLRIERARRRMMQAVPDATVVVMNPTHYAVALKYDPGENPAPLCVAKGLDTLALRIREVAEAAGVPIIEDPPLARSLYAAVDIDDIIPPKHYEAVAKIIGFILNGPKRRAS